MHVSSRVSRERPKQFSLSSAIVGVGDARSHRGDPPVFGGPPGRARIVLLQVAQNSECATLIGGETGARPSVVAAQETLKLPCLNPECGSQTKR